MKMKIFSTDLLRPVLECNCNVLHSVSTFSTSASQNVIHVSDRHHSTVLDTKVQADPIKKTCLYDLHIANGAKMVKFAGFYLPLKYDSSSILSSHLHTRSSCSLFDVSHMLQTRISGKRCIEFLESLCVTDIRGMENGQSALSLFTNDETGGILDDFIITKIDDTTLYLVSNASRQDADKTLLLDALDMEKCDNIYIEFFDSDEKSLIAIQGPKSMSLIQKYTDIDLSKLYFMRSSMGTVCGIQNCRITRCGYTGEDGFEISLSSDKVSHLVDSLLKMDEIKLAGLGARDTLRLEGGLCLYGNDIDETTTPVEAGLSWTIGKKRRENKNFPGAEKILSQSLNNIAKRRVGIIQSGGPPSRSGCQVMNNDNEVIGIVTSGCPSPSSPGNIAMAYVPPSYSKSGTNLRVQIRGNSYSAAVSKMPFVASKYYIRF